MRRLVSQYLDQRLSRRGFVAELGALGISAASAHALLASLGDADAAEVSDTGAQPSMASGNGSELLFATLEAAGIRNVFHGCGGGINRFLDGMISRPGMRNFLATNEGQAVAMAEGFHIASGGETGLAIIPRPGLPNAGGNIHNAMANRSSVVVLSARESNEYSARRGNIELVDWQDVMDPFMKWSYKMEHLARVPEFTRRAIKVARTPPGGPVFLQMTEDLYEQQGEAAILPQEKFRVARGIRARPDLIEQAARMLIEAENPLIVPGLEVTKAGAGEKLVELAELLGIPVMQGLSPFADFPNQHPLSLGWFTRFSPYLRRVDMMLLLGSQMPDEGHYVLTGPPPQGARIVHVSLEPEMLALAWPTDLGIVADAGDTAGDLVDAIRSLLTASRLAKIRDARYSAMTEMVRAERERKTERARRKWDAAPITYARLSSELNDLLEDDAIVVSESLFDVASWFDLGYDRKMQIGPQPGEVLGWATGVALGAKLARPDRQVVALSGDGAFLFQNALWSLARYDAPVLTVIYNNRAYNMNWAFSRAGGGAQARENKDLMTFLGDPDVDFAMLAKAHGIDAERVRDPGDLRAAIGRGIRATRDGRPYLLEVATERWLVGDYSYHPDISIAAMRSRPV